MIALTVNTVKMLRSTIPMWGMSCFDQFSVLVTMASRSCAERDFISRAIVIIGHKINILRQRLS